MFPVRKMQILLVLSLAATSAAGQDQKVMKVANQDAQELTSATVEKRQGKLWLLKDGKTTLVNRDVVIAGTRITAEGNVTFAGGNKIVLREGDRIGEDGSLVKAPPVDKMMLNETGAEKEKK